MHNMIMHQACLVKGQRQLRGMLQDNTVGVCCVLHSPNLTLLHARAPTRALSIYLFRARVSLSASTRLR